MRIFVSEDSPEIRKRLVAMLRRVPGVSVVGEAESVRAAIAGVLSTASDVLLLDLQLADGSGLDVLSSLKVKHPALRVIVLTNFATAQHRQASLAAGADVFLDKSQEFQRPGHPPRMARPAAHRLARPGTISRIDKQGVIYV
jgi:DNA-binding NarL/FixJ family response regulator